MSMKLLLVLVVGALCVAHAAQTKEYDLSHVVRGDLATVLAGKPVDGASTPLHMGSDGSIALLEESLAVAAEPDVSMSVTGLAMSLTVPLGSPNVACKVALDGRHYVDAGKHMLMGGVGVTFELSFLGLFKAHLTVKGSVFLFTTDHDTLAEIVQDLAEFILHTHHDELNEEVKRIFREMRTVVEDTHALTRSRLDTGMHDLQEQADLLDRRVRAAQAHMRTGHWQDAMHELGMDELREGAWPSMELPLDFKSPMMAEVLAPWQHEMKPLRDGLVGVLEAHGMDTSAAERMVDAEDESVVSGMLSVFVTDIENLEDDADIDVPWNGVDDTPPDVFVRVSSAEADQSVRTATVHDNINPSFFEEVQVAVFHRERATIKLEIVDADAVRDDVLHTLTIPRAWLRDAGRVRSSTISLGGRRRINVLLRWLPMTRAHAWARLETTRSKNVFALRKEGLFSDSVIHVRQAAAGSGWEWKTSSAINRWFPLRLARLSVFSHLPVEQRLVLAYLITTSQPVPSAVEHARMLMGNILVSEDDFLADLVMEHAEKQIKLVRAVYGAINHVHMHWKAAGGAAEQAAFARRARIRPLMTAASDALQRLADYEESPATLNRFALRRKLLTMVHKMGKKTTALLERVEQAAQYARLEPQGGTAHKTRKMRIDVALIVMVGGEAATKSGGAKVTADLGGGWGVRGIIVAPAFTAPATHTIPFDTYVGSLGVTVGPVTASGFALYKGFGDGSQGLYIFLDLTLPVSAADTDAMKGPETALEWLQGRMNTVRAIQAGVVTGVGEMDRSDVAQLASGVVLPQVRDALASQLKRFPKLFTSVGTKQTVTPGVSVRISFSAKKGETLFANAPALKVLGYVMSKQTVSLAHVLGAAGAQAANALSVGAEGSVETGYYVNLSEAVDEAEHQFHHAHHDHR